MKSSKTRFTGASTTPTAFTQANLPLPSSFHTAGVEEGGKVDREEEGEVRMPCSSIMQQPAEEQKVVAVAEGEEEGGEEEVGRYLR